MGQGDRDQALALGGLQAFFDANIIGIAFSAADGTIVAANDSYLQALGFTREDLAQGRVDWRAVTPPEYAEADAAALTEFAERGVSSPFEKEYIHPDGRRLPVVLASARIPETGGMATFVLDISARKAAEAALRRSEEQYRELFDAATDATFVIDRQTLRIIDANGMASVVYGYGREELLALTSPDLSAEPAATADFIRSVSGEPGDDPQTGERLHRRKDGTSFPVEFTARVLWREGGAVLLVTSRDLTERWRAEQALLQSKTELEEAQRVAHVGSFTWDVGSGALTWSTELHRIFGLDPRETPPSIEAADRLYGPETAAQLHDAVRTTVLSGEPYEVDATISLGDGRIRHVVERAEVVRGADGGVLGLRGTVADVTELREAQAVVDQAQRAEMVGRLAGGVAHDFNNLLTAIGGHAEFIVNTLEPDDERRPDVTSILEASARAADLTRQLLAFGRRDMLNPVITVPGDVVERLRPMLRSLVPVDMALVVQLEPTRACVRVDRDGLVNAVINLVLNARDAMPGGGTLTIATEVVWLDAGDPRLRGQSLPGDHVRLSVGDTGVGISEGLLPHIFEPFFTTKALGRGSGLGLPSVDGFLAQSGGWIAVETSPGVGSVFSMFLAVEPEGAVEAAGVAPSTTPATSGGETILLVDDEPAVRSITARLLRQMGYEVIEAADGSEALAVCARDRIDALVTDVVLPGLSGPDLAARCLARQPGLPVLLMSGYARESLAAQGREIAGTAFLAKPFTREALGQRVRELLDAR